MARVKSGPYGNRRHKKVLKFTKGQRGTKHLLFRRANEAMLKSMWYAYINAAARLNGTTYSRLTAALRKANIGLNRKMLADLAIRDPQAFAAVVAQAQQ
ncbi:50S ribosomal protein L20 [Anaerolineae bacterium AMX1]|nr:50S ribosomal protein L20 [Anaerolineae bacterium AMX1]